MLEEFRAVKPLRKQMAIHRIKMQSFFGKSLFNHKCDTITFSRPKEYKEIK